MAEKAFAHMVFFTLKERTAEGIQKLVQGCHHYLNEHPGTIHFSAGNRAEEMQRDVNDREFDVALHVVFESAAHHDAYQTHQRHLDFIEQHKDLWAQVRVFDSHV